MFPRAPGGCSLTWEKQVQQTHSTALRLFIWDLSVWGPSILLCLLPLHSTGPENPVNTDHIYQTPTMRVVCHLLLLVDVVGMKEFLLSPWDMNVTSEQRSQREM